MTTESERFLNSWKKPGRDVPVQVHVRTREYEDDEEGNLSLEEADALVPADPELLAEAKSQARPIVEKRICKDKKPETQSRGQDRVAGHWMRPR